MSQSFANSSMQQLYKEQQIKNLMLQWANIASISARDSSILASSIPIQNTRAMPKRSHDVLRDLSNTTPKKQQKKSRGHKKKAEAMIPRREMVLYNITETKAEGSTSRTRRECRGSSTTHSNREELKISNQSKKFYCLLFHFQSLN